jgi:DNA primase
MDIKDIKQQLTINQVLSYYSLKPDKSNRLHCPFHPDKTPSLQIYPATNTYCCFSSNCQAGTGDAIQFIQLKENCSKHEALVRATTMLENPTTTLSAKLVIDAAILPTQAVLTKVFSYYKRGLPMTKKAVAYLESRSLDYNKLDIAYNSGGLHVESKHHHLVECMVKAGLLKPRPAGGYTVWAKDCILFPLKNAENKIISLYGRSITNDTDSRHFYLPNRTGLYPGYPRSETTNLILTESIIDAASLLQQAAITEQYSILALYGTNGLTDEHQQAILSLPNLSEIILLLNADDAGKAATRKHYSILQQLLPEVTITQVMLPDGEDVNSILQIHDDPKILSDLIEQRTGIYFSFENKNPQITTPPVLPKDNKLITSNPELLIYDNCALRIEVLGGIKITGLDRLKVTLKVQHKERLTQPVWHSLDLYNHGQREQAINTITEVLETATSATATTLAELTTQLENYRLQRIESLQKKPDTVKELTHAQRQAAITELQKPNLLQRTSQLIALSGIVGETANALVAYLVYGTRKQPIPLHVMFLGASGSGKTYLQEKISELIPEEDKIEITQITENALYYFKQEELKHKLLLIEDLDGAMTVFYPLRELQTKRKISKTVTLKDNKGNLKTITLTVEGPVSVSGCTTKEKIYEDNANRCILLYTDMSKDQDKKINEYQTSLAGGEINRQREQQYKALFQNMQRVLRPIQIINPYAKWIQLPEQVFKPRRTMTLLLGFIEGVTFYHQYQRDIKKDAGGQHYIETTINDIEQAFALLKDVLFSKSDELTQATRSFFEHLKTHLTEKGEQVFTAQQIRKVFRLEPRTIQRYIRELYQYGLIKAVSGFKHRKGVEYAITDQAEYSQLKTAIDTHLQTILQHLRQL